MPPEVAVVEVTRTRTVVVEVPGPSYSDARVLAYLRTVLNTNGDLLTVASNTLARIAVGAAPAGSVPIWSGSSWSVGTLTVAVAWDDVTGKPSTFPPSTHAHTPADVTGFNAAAVDAVEAVGNGVLVTTGGTAAAVVGATTNHALLWNGTTWVAGAVPYSALSGVPSTFAPSSHTHTASEITDFNAEWTNRLLAVLTTSGSIPYRTAIGGIGESKQGTSALATYAIDWSAAHRFTKTLAGGDAFTHSNTEAKAAIYLVLAVNGQAAPSGIGTQVGGETWSSAWTTAYLWITKDGSGGYEYTLSGA